MVTSNKIIGNQKKVAALACILTVVAPACLYGTDASTGFQFLREMPWGNALIASFSILFFLAMAELAWRIILVMKYKPIPSVTDDQLPTCTIVVPAYNEGRQVFDTL